MLHVDGCAQEGVGGRAVGKTIGLELPDEQEDAAAALHMVDVPLTRGGILRRRALALPVEQLAVDRIIVVHGGGRIVFVRLV